MSDVVDDAADAAELFLAESLHFARGQVERQRIADGVIVCSDCSEPIPIARLDAHPHAARCIECQEAWESESEGDRYVGR